MRKRVAKVMLLGAVLPGGVHAVEEKTTSHPTQMISNVAQGKVQKKDALEPGKKIESADMSVAVAKTELTLTQAQEKQNGTAANPSETAEPHFRLRGVRG